VPTGMRAHPLRGHRRYDADGRPQGVKCYAETVRKILVFNGVLYEKVRMKSIKQWLCGMIHRAMCIYAAIIMI
jgi:hypothetical protein